MKIVKTEKGIEIDPSDLPYGENYLDDWTEDCPDWAIQCNGVMRRREGGSDEGRDKD